MENECKFSIRFRVDRNMRFFIFDWNLNKTRMLFILYLFVFEEKFYAYFYIYACFFIRNFFRNRSTISNSNGFPIIKLE